MPGGQGGEFASLMRWKESLCEQHPAGGAGAGLGMGMGSCRAGPYLAQAAAPVPAAGVLAAVCLTPGLPE